MCVQRNVRASAGERTGQNTDKGLIPISRIGIKIPDPSGNRTRAAGLEGRDSIDHATSTIILKTSSTNTQTINIIFLLNLCSGYLAQN